MPAWSPPPDIRFDHQAAADALTELRRTLAIIEDIVEAVDAALVQAQVHWRGGTGERTEEVWARQRVALRSRADELGRLSQEFMWAVDTARNQQYRRELLQARWELERRSEVRAS